MEILPLFQDRSEAGRRLAGVLERFRSDRTTVLGVPRGGVVVAAEVAKVLDAPLDVVLARKIGAPDQPELAIGAVVGLHSPPMLDLQAIDYLRIPAEYLEEEVRRLREEVDRRQQFYRGGRPEPDLRDRTVLVIDDGIATGYTLRAALSGVRAQGPARLVVAAPVAPPATCRELESFADDVICLYAPEPFTAVGIWYEDFSQTSDEEVRDRLRHEDEG